MTGLIWFVQVVHYPLFERVAVQIFASYQQAHQRLTTWVVAPALLVQAPLHAELAQGFEFALLARLVASN